MATKVGHKDSPQPINLHFPMAGEDNSYSLEDQPPRQIGDGEWSRTSPVCLNVLPVDIGSRRSRGSMRHGIRRLITKPLVVGWIVQHVDAMTSIGITPPGGNMQQSNSGRVVTLVAVSQGNVYVANAGDTDWTPATNSTGNTPPLNYTGIMQSTVLNQKLYLADGVNLCVYDPNTNTVSAWTATAGTIPSDSGGNVARLLCTWRGRVIHSGLLLDPQNYFASAVDVATDYNYSPVSTSATQAFSGNNAPQGLVGDVITSMCPYSDDRLIFFCDHETWMMTGDPFFGGSLFNISRTIGGAWGKCWAVDPKGTVYWMSNKMGVFYMDPTMAKPAWISQQIDQKLQDLDTGAHTFTLAWNDRYKGLDIFITSNDAPNQADTHFHYDLRTNSWWPFNFAQKNHSPLCACVFDGNLPDDRVTVIGSWDGFVRVLDPTATDDDGVPIQSSVVFGPILSVPGMDDMTIDDLKAIFSLSTDEVKISILVGPTAEEALASTPVYVDTLQGGRNFVTAPRRAGHAIYVKVDAVGDWASEVVSATIRTRGPIRARQKH